MFSKLVFIASVAIAVVSAQFQVSCTTAGLNQASDCTQFLNDFCNDVSIVATAIRVGDSANRCFVTPRGHSCVFHAYNSNVNDHSPSGAACKNAFTQVIDQCPFGGFAVVPNNGSYTYTVESNVALCNRSS
ncbi:hypothetical protein AN958_11516 [Leucoagaricus sp. SymC.cos]|nr:hypothetical protein AN958_11516 [Leucoagaricus sp. SymC.cos]